MSHGLGSDDDYGNDRFYQQDDPWGREGSGSGSRGRGGLIVLLSFAVVLVMVGAGAAALLLGGDDEDADPVAAAVPTATAVVETTAPAPTTPPPATPPPVTKPPAPKPSPTAAKPKVVASKNPAAVAVSAPPAPRAQATLPGCVDKNAGPQATYPEVRAALQTAAARTYWRSVPTIKVPERLMHAVAFTESTWRSNVLACDGGIGLMQVMPQTVTMLNNRFGTTWEVNTLQGNAYLGGQYLAWSTRYLGDLYFGGNYDLSNEALLTSVIAAYNVGVGAVDPTKGEAGIPNPTYVSRVKQYLQSCPCDAW
ncbi:MAG TPA: lytic transglycosylase domain-containing protein [Micromonosporaceae bacterium]|nr:lytic transglycosylase domain-containing protein [Micromonosporaceae bacterium]